MLQLFRKRLSNRKGFTLVELLVVISIIGILSAIAVPKFQNATNAAKIAKIQADLRTIDSAMAVYYAQNSAYPTATQIVDATKGTLTNFPTPPTDTVTTNPATAATAYVLNTTSTDANYGRATYNGVTADLVK